MIGYKTYGHCSARKAHGKEIFDNPQQVYTSYRFEPQENEELRFDVMAGSSCFQPLVANYYNGSTELFDRLNGFGASNTLFRTSATDLFSAFT